jgi:hypothetical protein
VIAQVAGRGEDDVRIVVERFRDRDLNFLTPAPPTLLSSEKVLDITHESLIRHWGRLQAWVEKEANSARVYRRLEQQAALWNQSNAELWVGRDLDRILDWRKDDPLNEHWAKRYQDPDVSNGWTLAMKFLDASLAQRQCELEEQERREEERKVAARRLAEEAERSRRLEEELERGAERGKREAQPEARYDVYLSYSAADSVAVEELARRLVGEGIRPLLNRGGFIVSKSLVDEVVRALDESATCAVIIGPSGLDARRDAELTVIKSRLSDSRGRYRVIPVLLPGLEPGQRGELPSFLAQYQWVEFKATLDDDQAFRRLVWGIRGVEPGPAAGSLEGQRPYRGLEPFDVEHAPFFFGREALTSWLLSRLNAGTASPLDARPRFLALVGPSGIGKSSLARAGLLASIKQGAFPDSQNWSVAVCRPGTEPVSSLARAMREISLLPDPQFVSTWTKTLLEDPGSLHQLAETQLVQYGSHPERRLVVLVDRFEEVFTLCLDESQRAAFIANLLNAAKLTQGRTVVLLTLRSDFYGRCASYPDLAAMLSDNQEFVSPMSDDELRRAIERPALLTGCEFEPGLVDLLVRDMMGQTGGLPLLQFTLLELWQRREGGRLRLADYDAIGRTQGVLEHRAEQVFADLAPAEKDQCRRIFLRLVQPGDGTDDVRRRATAEELRTTGGGASAELLQRTLDRLIDAQLVTAKIDSGPPNQPYYELAHEALIPGWTRLKSWIDADRIGLRTLRRLDDAAREWQRRGRDPSFLYSGVQLAAAQQWSVENEDLLSETAREFLNASAQGRP